MTIISELIGKFTVLRFAVALLFFLQAIFVPCWLYSKSNLSASKSGSVVRLLEHGNKYDATECLLNGESCRKWLAVR